MELVKGFADYGALGLTCLISILMVGKIYRDLTAERKSFHEEMHALEERYIMKADSWMAQFYERNHAQAEVVGGVKEVVAEMKEKLIAIERQLVIIERMLSAREAGK